MSVTLPPASVMEYLGEVNASAVYIARSPANLHYVGSTDNLLNTTTTLATMPGRFEYEWIGWVPTIQQARWLAYSPSWGFNIAQGRAFVGTTTEKLSAHIRRAARLAGINITRHEIAITRANAIIERVDRILHEWRRTGQLREFNRAYARYRRSANGSDHDVIPYEQAFASLRHLVCIELGTNAGASPDLPALQRRLADELPWLSREEIATR